MDYTDENARCCACMKYGCDLHHIKTRKAGGSDEKENLLPLCRIHHSEVHTIGMVKMTLKYFFVEKWLVRNGWGYNEFLKKWRR